MSGCGLRSDSDDQCFKLTPTPESYSHGPCAVIAEPRRSARNPIEENQAQAPA